MTSRTWRSFVEVAEDLGAVAGRQDAEEGVAIVGLEVLDHLGEPARVMLGEEVAQAGDLAVVDQLAEVGHQQRMSHGPSSGRGMLVADRSSGEPITSLPT